MPLMVLAVLLGIVEGITEFIPISSTGHLIIADHFLGFKARVGADVAECFEVVIQLGAILAVVTLYWERFRDLFAGQGSAFLDLFRPFRWRQAWAGLFAGAGEGGLKGPRGCMLLALTTLPALVLGVPIHKRIPFTPKVVILALAVGAVGILLAEWFKPRPETPKVGQITWRQALWTGFFQCFSIWPGMSRSASTIVGGMLSKVDRIAAAEYSFLAAVPIMVAASAYELHKTWRALSFANLWYFSIGFGVSYIVALLAIKTFIRLLQRCTLTSFAIYRLCFAGLFVLLIAMKVITSISK